MKNLALIFRLNVLIMGLLVLFIALFIIHIPFPFINNMDGFALTLSLIFYLFIFTCFLVFSLRKIIKEITLKNKTGIFVFTIIFAILWINCLYIILRDPTVISIF
ncbi:hypothetical protein K9M48_02275 [Candidatus Gracilibacteria bacterium]|nr:hypothetical protein [Candidatus Gracilibacteria bacterium]